MVPAAAVVDLEAATQRVNVPPTPVSSATSSKRSFVENTVSARALHAVFCAQATLIELLLETALISLPAPSGIAVAVPASLY